MTSIIESHQASGTTVVKLRHHRPAHWILEGLVMGATLVAVSGLAKAQVDARENPDQSITHNKKVDGYWGIWYSNGTSAAPYRYKYSGGLGSYCAKHEPFAVYCVDVDKTFFCYGGAKRDNSRRLLHMVSYFDHATGTVPRPTLLLDKQTSDAHDNPVISVDEHGYLWIFSTSHGRARPSYIHRSRRPYDIEEFEIVTPTRRGVAGEDVPIDNFSYMQAFYTSEHKFTCLFTRYNYPADRTSCFMKSNDGVHWSWQRLAAIEHGHYQIGGVGHGKVATMMNYHPQGKGLDHRTNLYYLESLDGGESWQTVDGETLSIPLMSVDNPALVRNYGQEELLVYLKDLQFDARGRPVLLYITSRGHQAGPENDPRTWCVAHWSGEEWSFHEVTTSDHNYDFGSQYLEADGTWRLIAPTEPGPQPYGGGGEMVMWTSGDEGVSWNRVRQLTFSSPRNHGYARQPIHAHPDFYAFWADGDSRQPSESALYFCTRQGDVYRLPRRMSGATAQPELVSTATASRESVTNAR